MVNKTGGFPGIIAGESAISSVDETQNSLNYRGYSIYDLAQQSSFEEVAYLLTRGRLPNQMELSVYLYRLMSLREISTSLKNILELLPAQAHPMDVLRTICSMLGMLELEAKTGDQYAISDRLIACFPSALLYWYHFHNSAKRIHFGIAEDSTAGYFLALLYGSAPDKLERKALDVSLILYAEQAFAPSTFVARMTTSTRSDFYSAICAAIGALRGPLHGGANEMALKLLKRFDSPQHAEVGIKAMLAKKELIMGFGHRVYNYNDPRSDIIKAWARELAERNNEVLLYTIAERIEHVMHIEKGLYPNVDFYSALAYYFCDIPSGLYTPIFALSRLTGWSAHIFEQRINNKIIRPAAAYVGPALQTYVPLEKRLSGSISAIVE